MPTLPKNAETFERIVRNGNLNTSYSTEDFVNPTSYDPHDAKQKAYVVLNGGYVLAIVFSEYYAYCEQDALDEAADSGKLDGLQITPEELKDYETGTYTDVGNEYSPDGKGWPEYDGRVVNLGNASEPFDGESLDVWILPAAWFAEDPFLMCPDRIQTYLEDQQDRAKRKYDATDVQSDDWLPAYGALKDLEDALTLFRLSQAR